MNSFDDHRARFENSWLKWGDASRQEFAGVLEDTIQQIDSGRFLPHSGIRFPQNPCLSCAYVGLCLGKPEVAEAQTRPPAGRKPRWCV